MINNKVTNCLLGALFIITCTMFVWTISYITTSNDTQIPTAISAFNA